MGQPTDVVRNKFAALNAQDASRMAGYFGPSVEKQVPGAVLHGRDEVAGFVAVFWEAFPDIKLAITAEVEEGSAVMVQGRITGTHLGTFHTPAGDMPPTRRHVDLSFSDYYRLEGGLIVESHLHLDRLELLEQLGATPAAASA